MSRRIALGFAVCLWIAVVCAGVGFLWSYGHAAGAPATPPQYWPSETAIPRVNGHHTLVMLAHPKCPCSRASVEELSNLMTNCAGRLDAYVLFVTPKSAPRDWYQTDLWSSAARIPGVKTMLDQDGKEAARFGALTSGQVVLYDPNGKRVFSGGITESRGHVGDNKGRSAIESLVDAGTANTDSTVVFGCPLFNPGSECVVPSHDETKK